MTIEQGTNKTLERSSASLEASETVIFFEDFENGPAGWTPKNLTDTYGSRSIAYWRHATFADQGVMECSTNNPCFVTTPGYGNYWRQTLTRAVYFPTYQEVVVDLISVLDHLVADGLLDPSQAGGMIRKLEEALDFLNAERTKPASNKLSDFIDQVDALARNSTLSGGTADQLRNNAQDVIDFLDGTVSHRLEYELRMVVESGYDFLWVEYSFDPAFRNGQGATWTLASHTGTTSGVFSWPLWPLSGQYGVNTSSFLGKTVYFRFRFTSDRSVSHEDGRASGLQPCRLLGVGVRLPGKDYYENFGATDGGWLAAAGPRVTFPVGGGEYRLALDPSVQFPSPGIWPGHALVAYSDYLSMLPFSEPMSEELNIAIESPPIPLPTADQYILEFDVYNDQGTPFDPNPMWSGIAYGWDVSTGDNLPCVAFRHSNSFNASPNGVIHRSIDITPFVDAGASSLVIRLRAYDFGRAGFPLDPISLLARDYYRRRGPFFDNVKLIARCSTAQTAISSDRDAGLQRPTRFTLAQNSPNPFNPSTTIALSLPWACDYSLFIYNVAGMTVRRFSGSAIPGRLSIVWDGRDQVGNPVASGVYLYSVQAEEFRDTKRMLLLK